MGISAMFLNSGGGMTTQQAVQKGIEARTGMATVGAECGFNHRFLSMVGDEIPDSPDMIIHFFGER